MDGGEKKLPVTVMDFSGIYREECFYRGERPVWIDCRNIHGTNCFCDPEARRILEKKMRPYPARGIHFIDSGNYHYVTEFWLGKVRKKFNLVVFDHHTDLRRPLFENLLSCGSWILNALEHNPYIGKVFLLGISREQRAVLIQSPCRDRIFCHDEQEIRTPDFLDRLHAAQERLPMYISIDKDVLDRRVVETNWDQGCLTSAELRNILRILLRKHSLIGVDICGECEPVVSRLLELRRDDLFNRTLLRFLEEAGTEATKSPDGSFPQ